MDEVVFPLTSSGKEPVLYAVNPQRALCGKCPCTELGCVVCASFQSVTPTSVHPLEISVQMSVVSADVPHLVLSGEAVPSCSFVGSSPWGTWDTPRPQAPALALPCSGSAPSSWTLTGGIATPPPHSLSSLPGSVVRLHGLRHTHVPVRCCADACLYFSDFT